MENKIIYKDFTIEELIDDINKEKMYYISEWRIIGDYTKKFSSINEAKQFIDTHCKEYIEVGIKREIRKNLFDCLKDDLNEYIENSKKNLLSYIIITLIGFITSGILIYLSGYLYTSKQNLSIILLVLAGVVLGFTYSHTVLEEVSRYYMKWEIADLFLFISLIKGIVFSGLVYFNISSNIYVTSIFISLAIASFFELLNFTLLPIFCVRDTFWGESLTSLFVLIFTICGIFIFIQLFHSTILLIRILGTIMLIFVIISDLLIPLG